MGHARTAAGGQSSRRQEGIGALLAFAALCGGGTVVLLAAGSGRGPQLAALVLSLLALAAGSAAIRGTRRRERAWHERFRAQHERLRAVEARLAAATATRAPAAPAAAVRTTEDELRENSRRAFLSLARRVQAIVNRQLRELREMEDRHGESPRVFSDLLQVDHGTALIGRLADSIAVLCGSRPGPRWAEPASLLGVLRGSMARITDYQRVELGELPAVAVDGMAVEPLVHALAELLDNATRYSPPHSAVRLGAHAVAEGVAIEVEDAGVGLGPAAAAYAERRLRGTGGDGAGPDLAGLGESPRLGLTVVGQLARTTGFEISLRPSSRGGVRAVVLVPEALTADPAAVNGASGAPWPPTASTAARTSHAKPRPAQAPRSVSTGSATNGATNGDAFPLPRRRRHRPSTDAPDTVDTVDTPPTADPAGRPAAAPQPGLWLAAFHAAAGPAAPAGAPSVPTEQEPR